MSIINTAVQKGYTVRPTENGGFVVQTINRDGFVSEPMAAFTTPEDLIKWLAGSHLADVVVMSQDQIAQMIGGAYTQGQASEATKQ